MWAVERAIRGIEQQGIQKETAPILYPAPMQRECLVQEHVISAVKPSEGPHAVTSRAGHEQFERAGSRRGGQSTVACHNLHLQPAAPRFERERIWRRRIAVHERGSNCIRQLIRTRRGQGREYFFCVALTL